MENKQEAINNIAEQFQEECEQFVSAIFDNTPREKQSNTLYDSATSIFIFRKLAELQFEINTLKHDK